MKVRSGNLSDWITNPGSPRSTAEFGVGLAGVVEKEIPARAVGLPLIAVANPIANQSVGLAELSVRADVGGNGHGAAGQFAGFDHRLSLERFLKRDTEFEVISAVDEGVVAKKRGFGDGGAVFFDVPVDRREHLAKMNGNRLGGALEARAHHRPGFTMRNHNFNIHPTSRRQRNKLNKGSS